MPGCVFAGQPRQSAAQRFVRQATLFETREIVQARVEETAGGPYPIALLTGQPYHECPWCFVFSGETWFSPQTGQERDRPVGAGPFVVSRDGSRVWQPGSAYPPERWLDWYGHRVGHEDDADVRHRLTAAQATQVCRP